MVYSGSRWETQGTYGAKEQNIAIADAKSLARVSTVKGVKVVKEFFDDHSNVSRSLTVFEHNPNTSASKSRAPATKPRAPATSRRTQQSSKASMQGDARDDNAQASDVKRPTFLGTAVKIMLSIVFSLATAMVVTQMASFALQGIHSVGMLKKSDFLVMVFILVFVITALALVTRVLMNLKRIAPLLPPLPSVALNPKPIKHKRDMRLTPAADKVEDGEDGDHDKSQSVEAERIQAEAELKKAKEEERKKTEEERQNKADEAQEVDALSEIINMNAFAQDAFEVLQGDKTKQDAHTVFGLVLFLVGAVQAMRAKKNLPENIAQTVANKALGSLGLSKERCNYFMAHTDEYLISNPRYSQMFQAGRGAMNVYMTDGVGPRSALSDALGDWEKPKSKSEQSNQPVTVLFTDIAGSTAMTQKLGDAGAQEVVRAHNKIVRGAIQSFTGKEIKHTGDGIMASFPSAAAGVEAAIDMQKQTKEHNASDPSHPLGLKIGLNAGDPISEDDDLFGTTVQLAARIVDKAGSGQILVSGSVHGLSQGKSLKFVRFADLDMKGFDESVTVYQAVWDPDAKVEAPGKKANQKKAEPNAKSAVQPKPEAAPKETAQTPPQAQKPAVPETPPAADGVQSPAPQNKPAQDGSAPPATKSADQAAEKGSHEKMTSDAAKSDQTRDLSGQADRDSKPKT